MSQKAEKPILSGQRIKTRKRDEKEKYDPSGFRDAVIAGLEKAGPDLDQVSKFLDSAGSKLDYRRYGEALFDILIAGGLLVPGGSIAVEADKLCRTNQCIFCAPADMESIKNYEQVFLKLTRRYKYLEKMFEEEMKKILIFIKGFTPEERLKLARITALWLVNGALPPPVLQVLINEHLMKENLALDFLLEVFATYKAEKGLANLISCIKKAGLDGRLMELLPANKRTEESFRAIFHARGLGELVKLQAAQASREASRDLQNQLCEDLAEGRTTKELITSLRDAAVANSLPESEVVGQIWAAVMSQVEWNKKEELVAEQSVKHLKQYTGLFQAFATTPKSELALMLRIQEFCYGNMNFMKCFQKIIMLFYKTNVLSEDVIIKWYNETHSTKGKMVFIDQMRKFVEWLQNAEEESEEDDDADED